MADAEALIERLDDHDYVSYIGLVMNEKGLDRALETKVGEIGMVVVATDSYNRKNQGVDTDESVRVWGKIAARAGILDWRVADIGAVHGALMQLTED